MEFTKSRKTVSTCIIPTTSATYPTSNSSLVFYFPPLSFEITFTIVCTVSILSNILCCLTVRILRQRGRSSFLLSIGMLVATEIILCTFRSINGIMGSAAIVTNTIQYHWFDWPDTVLWSLVTVIQFVRNWWLVAITCMRMVMVCFPLLGQMKISDGLVKKLFIGTCVFSVLLPIVILAKTIQPSGVILFDADSAAVIITVIVMSNGAPTVIIIVLTTCIATTLMRSKSSTHLQQDQEESKDKDKNRATRTVILIALCFLLFQLPLCVISVVYLSKENKDKTMLLRHAFYIALNLIYVDTLSNCVVLLASNRTFRVMFCGRLRCQKTEEINKRLNKRRKPSASGSSTAMTSLLHHDSRRKLSRSGTDNSRKPPDNSEKQMLPGRQTAV